MEINYKEIGKRVKKCRINLKLTQQQLAEKADLSITNVSHIERGATKLSLPSLIALANALNTTTDYLLMDVLDNSEIQFKKEFETLFEECSNSEYRLLYNICNEVLKNIKDNSNK